MSPGQCPTLLGVFGPSPSGGNAGVAAFFASLPSWLQAAAMAQSPARVVDPVPPSPGGRGGGGDSRRGWWWGDCIARLGVLGVVLSW